MVRSPPTSLLPTSLKSLTTPLTYFLNLFISLLLTWFFLFLVFGLDARWVLEWSDEFNGPSLDTTKWTVSTPLLLLLSSLYMSAHSFSLFLSIPVVVFCFVLFCFVLFCFVLFCFVLSCLVLSCLVLSCLVFVLSLSLFLFLFLFIYYTLAPRRKGIRSGVLAHGEHLRDQWKVGCPF